MSAGFSNPVKGQNSEGQGPWPGQGGISGLLNVLRQRSKFIFAKHFAGVAVSPHSFTTSGGFSRRQPIRRRPHAARLWLGHVSADPSILEPLSRVAMRYKTHTRVPRGSLKTLTDCAARSMPWGGFGTWECEASAVRWECGVVAPPPAACVAASAATLAEEGRLEAAPHSKSSLPEKEKQQQ